MSFLGEIKRRKVFQVGAVYIVVAWLIIQVVDVISEPLSLPDWMDTFVIVFVAIGFPLALVLSWAYDLTPSGVVRTEELTPETAEPAGAAEATLETELPAETLDNSVAVLPFENLSPNPDDAYFSAGIHEELLNQLAKIEDLRVIARTSVMQYENARRSISEIARELRVGTVMEGSVRYAGKRVRVTAQLIDATTEDHLWSEVYERDLADIFAIQADIATHIATALEAQFSADEQARVERPLTKSSEAYVLYLKAMAAAGSSGLELAVTSREARTTIESCLDQAIAADPDFALAYVQRARVTIHTLFFDIGTDKSFISHRAQLEGQAKRDFDEALALDPSLGAAYAGIAQMHQYNYRREEAQAAYERALELCPNDADVLVGNALFKAIFGEHDEATRLGRWALALDPNSGHVHFWIAMVYLMAQDMDAAAAGFRNAVELAPTSAIARADLSLVEIARGNLAEAVEEAGNAEELLSMNANPAHLGAVIYAYGRLARSGDAIRLNERLQETAAERRVSEIVTGYACLAIGDHAEALSWFNRAADNREPYEAFWTVLSVASNWFQDPVLEQPRFEEVRARLGFTLAG